MTSLGAMPTVPQSQNMTSLGAMPTVPQSADEDGFWARDIYEDEYDDTYDTNVVGADDADSADELTTLRYMKLN